MMRMTMLRPAHFTSGHSGREFMKSFVSRLPLPLLGLQFPFTNQWLQCPLLKYQFKSNLQKVSSTLKTGLDAPFWDFRTPHITFCPNGPFIGLLISQRKGTISFPSSAWHHYWARMASKCMELINMLENNRLGTETYQTMSFCLWCLDLQFP